MKAKVLDDARILVVLLGSLGDLVRGLSIAGAIKTQLPKVRLSWLVEDRWSEIVSSNPFIDEVIVFERKQGLRGIWRLYRALRNNRFDVTLDLQRHLKSGLCSWLSGAPRRIGFNPQNTKEYNHLFNNEQIPYFSETHSKLLHYLKFIEYLGLPTSTQLDFGFDSIEPSKIAGELLANIGLPYLAVVLGSSWSSKDWFAESYEELIEIVTAKKVEVVLLGDRGQQELASRLIDKQRDTKILNLVAKTSLIQLVAVLKGAKVAVGPDSGPGHIAAAVGTPYVSIFGPTAPERVAPFGNEHLVVRSNVWCSPCNRKVCPGLGKICLQFVTAQDVWGVLRPILLSDQSC